MALTTAVSKSLCVYVAVRVCLSPWSVSSIEGRARVSCSSWSHRGLAQHLAQSGLSLSICSMNKYLSGATEPLREAGSGGQQAPWKVGILGSCFPVEHLPRWGPGSRGTYVSLSGYVPRAQSPQAARGHLSFLGPCFCLKWPQGMERSEQNGTAARRLPWTLAQSSVLFKALWPATMIAGCLTL